MSENDQIAGQSEVEASTPEETQDAPMPSAEQNPDTEVSDRTKEQFEKLTESNKRLKEELDQLKAKSTNVFNDFYGGSVSADDYSHLGQTQVDEVSAQYVDDYGNVNLDAVTKALKEANERAKRAEDRANMAFVQSQKAEEARQLDEAHSKHPWLDRNNKESFSEEGYQLVLDRLVRYKASGVEKPLVEIANEIARIYKPQADVDGIKQEAVAEYKESAKKAQASAPKSNRGQAPAKRTYEELRNATSLGDTAALDERLDKLTS